MAYGGGGRGGFRGGGFSRGPREMFDITCSKCSKPAQVPFKPDGNRPVYCRDCFQSQRPPSFGGGGSAE